MNGSDRGTALITGAAGGIGSAIARLLSARGVPVALAYRSRRPDDLIRELSLVDAVFSDQCNLSDPSDVARFVASLHEAVGDVRTVIHAAGPHVPMVHLSRVTPADFATQMREDVDAFFNVATALLPSLRRTRGSLTVVTTAATARFPVRDGLSSAPKAAVEALVRGLAAEEGRFGVRVNCVGPGMLTDGMAERLIANGDLDQNALDITMRNIPLRMFGTADDIAEAVEFLSSDRARFITGQKLDVDGGYSV